MPIEKPKTTNQWTVAPQITHTTFMTQSLFFLLILLENLLLALIPILLHDGDSCCIPLSTLTSAFFCRNGKILDNFSFNASHFSRHLCVLPAELGVPYSLLQVLWPPMGRYQWSGHHNQLHDSQVPLSSHAVLWYSYHLFQIPLQRN